MKLLFAIKSLNVGGGGAERVLVDVANGLARRGHKINILTFDYPGKEFYELDPAINRLDLAIGTPGQPTPRLGFVRAIPRIRRMVRESGTDLLVPFMHATYVPLAGALLGVGIPMVVSEHTDAAHYENRPIQRFLAAAVERIAFAKTVPSKPVWAEFPKHRRDRIHVLPNPVDLRRYSKLTMAPVDPPHLLSVGRMMQQKNHLDLVRAFACVAHEFPDWTLRIVGDGELRGELEAEVARLDMSGRIAMPGATRDIAHEYAASSLVVLPSLYESFGLVAAEALASARPVLAFDNCLGIAEMVESGRNGLLVPGGVTADERVGNLAQGLRRLTADSELRRRLGQAGPASVQRYALEEVLDAWEEFLLRIVARVQAKAGWSTA